MYAIYQVFPGHSPEGLADAAARLKLGNNIRAWWRGGGGGVGC